jgi:hypothetical protein
MPRNITVTFDDGTTHVYQGAPDDVTPDQVEARAAKEFGKKVRSLDGGRGAAAGAPKPEPGMLDNIKQGAGNLIAGAVRGAGSIGATILAPRDALESLIARKMGAPELQVPDRRQAMDAGLQAAGADPDSLLFKGGKLVTEVAGTAGAGGAVANTLGRSSTIAANAPNLLQSIRTAGMTAGNATGATNALVRATGGAISGGVSAGMVDPDQAGTGAAVGAALPGALKLAGMAGSSVGRVLRGPEQAADVAQAVQAARGAGYVIPPTQARPTLGNRLLEGFSGKIPTAQNASAANQEVTNRLAAKALGLADDVKLTPEALDEVRNAAGKAYGELAGLPVLPAQAANSLTNTPGRAAIKPAELVKDLRQARNDSTAWFRAYQRSASPADQDKAKAAKALATRLEGQLEEYARSLGRPDLVDEMVEARKLIAKTYTVEGALNQTTGNVDALKLAKDLGRGKPLSGELKQAANFAQQFKTAARTPEGMGSLPQTSPIDWLAALGLSTSTSNPLLMASVMARPGARALALSPVVQNRLVQPQGNALATLVSPSVRQLGYRAAPVLAADQ